MLLHSTRRVLAAIIWMILLHDWAKGAIPKALGLPRLVSNSIGLYRRESATRDSIRENKILTIEHERPNVETRPYIEAADGRIIAENDMVVDAEKNAARKRHVQQKLHLSLETSPISSENEKTKEGAYPAVVRYEVSNNEAQRIVQPHSKATALVAIRRDANIVARSDDDDAFRNNGSNVSKTAKRIEMENDAVSNGSSSKDIARHPEEASNFTRTRATKASTIVSSNTSDAISQDRNSSLKNHSSEYHNSTNGMASQRSSSEEKGSSWQDDHAFDAGAEASLKDQRSNDHEFLVSGEPPETASSLNIRAEDVGEWESAREKTSTGNTGFSISDPKTRREKPQSQSPGALGIFQFVKKAKSTLSRRRQDPTTGREEAPDEYETRRYAEVRSTQVYHDDSGASDFFVISANPMEMKADQSSDSSAEHTRATSTTARESLGESSKGLSGLAELPGNLGHQADSPGAMTNEGWEKDTARHSIGCYLHAGALSESERLKKLSSPCAKEPYHQRGQERKLRGMSYLDYEGVEGGHAGTLLDETSERKSGKTRITEKNNDGSRQISEERNYVGKWNNTDFRRTSPASVDNGVSLRIREYVDNPDAETRVHGNVVDNELTGLQRDREAHKTFIGQKYVDDTMVDSYQEQEGQVQVQESKKYGPKLIPDKRAIEMDGAPLGQKDEASESRQNPLVNTTAFSWLLAKRENNLLDSITSEIGDDVSRKMESSGGEQNPRDSRKIRISRDDDIREGVMFSKVSVEMEPRSVQFLRATATVSDASGSHDVTVGRENFILKIFQTTEASSSLDSSLAEVDPWDFASDRDENGHRNDQQRETSVILGTPRSQAQLGKNIRDNRKTSSRIGIIDALKVHHGDQSQRRIQSVDDSHDGSADRRSQAGTTDGETARTPTAVINESKQRRNTRRQIESSIGQGNYIGASKINGTNDPSVVNGSEFLDSNKTDLPTARRDSRNNGNEVIPNASSCETCEVAEKPGKAGNDELGKFILADRQGINARKIASSISGTRTLESPLRSEEKRGNGDLFDRRVFNTDDSSMGDVQSKVEEREGKRVERVSGGVVALGHVRITTGQPNSNLIVTGKGRSSKRGSLPKMEKIRAIDERDVTKDENFDRGIGGYRRNGQKLHSNLSKFSETSAARRSNELSYNTSDISWDSKNVELHSNPPMESSSNSAGSSAISDVENLMGKPPTISSMRIDSFSIDRPTDPSEFLKKQEFSEVSHIWPGGNKDVAKHVNARAKQMKRGFTSRDASSFFIAEATPTAFYQDYRATVATKTGKLPDADSVNFIDDHPRTMQPSTTHSSSFGPVGSSNDDQPPFSKMPTLLPTDSTSSPSGPSSSNRATLKPFIATFSSKMPTLSPTDSTASASGPSSSRLEILKPFIATFSSPNPIDIENPITHNTRQAARNELVPASLADPTNVDTWTTHSSNPSHESTFSFRHTNSSHLTSRKSKSFEQSPGKPYYERVRNSADARNPNETMQDNSTRPTTALNQWPVKHSAVVEGDLVLGGLMMVHEREDSVTCGPVMPQGGVQALEAMLYTLDWLNERDLVPGVKIGAHILDDCDKDTYGLEMAVDFIKVPERETNLECSDRSRTAVKINTLHQVLDKVSGMKNLEYVGYQAHNEELTKRVINYYLVMRGHFLARSVNENNHARKIKTKDNRKKSKL